MFAARKEIAIYNDRATTFLPQFLSPPKARTLFDYDRCLDLDDKRYRGRPPTLGKHFRPHSSKIWVAGHPRGDTS
jgi:hypothetical protein